MAAQSNVAECCRVDTPIACLSNAISSADSDHCLVMSVIGPSRPWRALARAGPLSGEDRL